MKHFSLLFLALIATTALWAAGFIVDGIAYNTLGGDSVAVISKSSPYSGSVIIPATVSYISFPCRVTSIGDYAFSGCTSLTSITIPNSVTSIGESAFSGCTSLTSIDVDAANTHYASVDGVLFNYAKDSLIQYPIGNTRTTYTIPNSVTSIGEDAFTFCTSLTSITIPNSVTSIGNYAFTSCRSLTSITIPNSVTSIGGYAFWYCSYLTSITISNSVTSIGEGAFIGCSSITSITIPNSVTSIGGWAFSDCTSLTSIDVDAANTHYASIDGVLFNYANDTLIQYPAANTRIEYTIPNSVTSIGVAAFIGCSSLTSINIPNSVTSIGNAAFYYCKSLKSITCYATTPPACGEDCFYDVDKSIPLYVPVGSIQAYQQAYEWNNFTNIQAISAEVVPTTTEVQIEAGNSTITITWPIDPDADSYTIEVKKGDILFCTLTFNAQGQLLNIAFAPGRGTTNDITMAAEAVAGGYRFTITGLDAGTKYTYEVDTQDANGTTIANYTGSFSTTGGDTPTTLNETSFPSGEDRGEASKFLHNGHLYIQHNNRTYTPTGQEL